MDYKTPGVYIEEKSMFPPSVAQVETAIPAFIGYTETALDDDDNEVDLSTTPYIKRISSLLEYERYFGKTSSAAITVKVDDDGNPSSVDVTAPQFLMYPAVQLFYSNGGGPCYIVAVKKIGGTGPEEADLLKGVAALRKKDEPTIIVFPDAVNLADIDKYAAVYQEALAQAKSLGDRFVVMDIYDGVENSNSAIGDFRTKIGTNFLNFGAAYTPYLSTNISPYYHQGTVTFDAPTGNRLNNKKLADVQAFVKAEELKESATTLSGKAAAITDAADKEIARGYAVKAAEAAVMAANTVADAAVLSGSTVAASILSDAEQVLDDAKNKSSLTDIKTAATDAITAADEATKAVVATTHHTNILAGFNSLFEAKMNELLSAQYLTLPPSSAMAGVYATVDRTRGVWKAPANISLNRVIAPSAKITDAEQSDLNVHSTGKSINAIRAFTGKGTIVWGARTLAGNDNEWRYISVRRFYNMVEESVKKSTEVFVFEANNANTWVKVRAMIENFLTLQWRAGALAGASTEDAFFVRVGLGQTMTSTDILEGRMIVEIGMAVVRPAEFIILKFSHKMQE